MSEIISNKKNNESLQENEQVVELHNNSLVLDSDHALRTIEEAREQAFNGKILAEIELPAKVYGQDLDKTLAILDFSKDIPEKGKAILFNPSIKKELDNLGVTRSRYGLITLNYTPEELLVGFIDLRPEQTVTIGRSSDEHNNYLLGLNDARDDNSHLSREQLSIHLDKDNHISIEDHSTNGTKVVIPK